MKASELRIGNWMHFDNLLGDSYDYKVTPRWFRQLGMDLSDNLNVEINNYHKPIPLTEEWLDRTMFEKSSNLICGDYTIRIDEIGCLGIWLETGRYSLMDWNTGDIFTSHDNRIKFVHQLQNLYFALTNTELIWSGEK